MMAQKVHVVKSSSGQLQEQYNHVQDQEEDANYVSSYQGGSNEQRTNYQGGQDHDQWRPLQQWNSNHGWNNQQNKQGWSANSQGNRGAGSSQAYNASRDLCTSKATNLHPITIKVNNSVYPRIIMNKRRRLQISW
uniref:Uncharacterized protein n=1 Tax=Solanum tuberosum TaxID=4113 RepID=M1DMA4_SOLTU